MEQAHLFNAAGAIVRNNLSANVKAVAVEWSGENAELKLLYYFDVAPTEDDLELQELSMCELIAEFSDIRTSKCHASVQPFIEERSQPAVNIVYVRRA